MRIDMTMPILMTEEYWRNSPMSIARFYGGMDINGHRYVIVNKDGITLAELSDPKGPHYVGDDRKAIEPGEPCDMILSDWLPVYKNLGRDRTIEVVKQGISLDDAIELTR